MAKPTPLAPETMNNTAPAPSAATMPRRVRASKTVAPANDTPMQIRVPKREARAIKVAAAESDRSISEFMLECFHAYMRTGKHGNSRS